MDTSQADSLAVAAVSARSGLAAVAGWVGLAAATLQSWGERLHSREDDVDVAVGAGGLAAGGGGRPCSRAMQCMQSATRYFLRRH